MVYSRKTKTTHNNNNNKKNTKTIIQNQNRTENIEKKRTHTLVHIRVLLDTHANKNEWMNQWTINNTKEDVFIQSVSRSVSRPVSQSIIHSHTHNHWLTNTFAVVRKVFHFLFVFFLQEPRAHLETNNICKKLMRILPCRHVFVKFQFSL